MSVPRATYRLQFNPSFRFNQARGVVPYLRDLGISDLYASPIFSARVGSAHGYDGIDPNAINPELGGRGEFDDLMETVRGHGMGWIQDIVPNHMAFDGSNRFLRNLFEAGPASRYAFFFDVDWEHPDPRLRGRLLAPFLGETPEEALEKGDIRLEYGREGFYLRYHNLSFPVLIRSYAEILSPGAAKGGAGDFEGADQVAELSARIERETAGRETDFSPAEIKAALWRLYSSRPGVRAFLEETLLRINRPRSGLLGRLLAGQVYRLDFWRTALETINYRRFFTVSELISVRVEREEVFEETHRLILDLCRGGRFTGLRVDHVDGLLDPAAYLRRLRRNCGEAYLIVEKILGRDETLPPDWPVQGTTGYEFLNRTNGLFVNQTGEKILDEGYQRFAGRTDPLEDQIREGKRLILNRYMKGDFQNLGAALIPLAGDRPEGARFSPDRLVSALAETLVCFPVYRTYTDTSGPRPADRIVIASAARAAAAEKPDLGEEIRFIEEILRGEGPAGAGGAAREGWISFAMKFQQMTGPLMAKGFEDTVLYRHVRLLSLNEVGGDPAAFGTDLEAWHRENIARLKTRPHGLNAGSTHDTKRGEDARARLNVLSEIPSEWIGKVFSWAKMNKKLKRKTGNRTAPDANEEYLLYQTLVGARPFLDEDPARFPARVEAFMIKAAREAKENTGWIPPVGSHEDGIRAFVSGLFSPDESGAFLRSLEAFARRVGFYGILNSLSQTLLKATVPGVPDFYQGSEFWDFNLVDPDNRRPVDFEDRLRCLGEIRERAEKDLPGLIQELWNSRRDGRIKLFVIWRVLAVRAAHPGLFERGDYFPVEARGERAENLIAFVRRWKDRWVLAVAPRFLTGMVREDQAPVGPAVWGATELVPPGGAPRNWKEVFSGRVMSFPGPAPAGDLLREFPAALLIGGDDA